MQNVNNTHIVKYPLASAGRRILAKTIDILILFVLVLCLGLAIFCTDPNFSWWEELNVSGWRYGVFVLLMTIVFYGLLFVLPLFWKKTIGMKAMKLFYYNKNKNKFAWGLFKHEIFVWEIIVFISFIMGIMMSFLNQDDINSFLKGLNSIFANKPDEGVNVAWYYVGTTFSCLYAVSVLFLFAIIVGICIKNTKPAFHDKSSAIYVAYKKIEKNETPKNIKPSNDNIDGPGAISYEKLEEIDNI